MTQGFKRALALCATALLATPSWAALIMQVPTGTTSPTAPTAPAAPAAAANMVLSSTNVDFGSVVVTGTATLQVSLTNTGTATGTVDIVNPSAPFSLTHDCPADLAPAASCTLSFTFAPAAAGSLTSTATVVGQSVILGGFGDAMTVAQMAAGDSHTLVLKTDGTLWVAGANNYGQLGLGDNADRSTLVQVTSMGTSAAKIIASYDVSMVLKKDGTLWGTGRNSYGELGLGDKTARNAFTRITSIGTGIASIVNGYGTTFVLKTDGSLWETGTNSMGELGRGNTTSYTSFVQNTAMGTNNAQVAAGLNFSLVLKSDGTLWGTGQGMALGITPYVWDRVSYAQVTDRGSSVAMVVSGSQNTLVLKKDGTVWGVGYNSAGELGLGDYSTHNTFSQVSSLGNSVIAISSGQSNGASSHTLALMADGSLWSAGFNYYGQLGLGDTQTRPTFSQVSSLGNSVVAIAAGGNHSLVKLTDGTLWVTGLNNHGQAALGDTATRTSFTIVP